MIERFEYPPELGDQIRQQARHRLIFFALFLSPFWVGGFVVSLSGDVWLASAIAILPSFVVAFADFLVRRFERQTLSLAGHSLDCDGLTLQQLSPDGSVIGRINLKNYFTVSYPYFAFGNAIYTVQQPTVVPPPGRIKFSSRIGNAEHLVRNVLQSDKWPPGGDNATDG